MWPAGGATLAERGCSVSGGGQFVVGFRKDLIGRVQDRQTARVLTHDRFDDDARSRLDARDAPPTDEHEDDAAAAVCHLELERRRTGHRLQAHGLHAAGQSRPLPVLQRRDRHPVVGKTWFGTHIGRNVLAAICPLALGPCADVGGRDRQ